MVVLLLLLGTAAAASGQSTVRVVAYNIKHGRGMDDAVDLQRIAEVLRRLDADVIALQEVDNRTERTGGVDQVSVLAELLGYRGYHGAHRPYQGGYYGNAILTRLPVLDVQTHEIPAASGSALTVHEASLGPLPAESGGSPVPKVSVVSVHLAGTPEERLQQANRVSEVFANAEHPVILAGDFNGRPNDPVLQQLGQDWMILEKSGDPRTYPSPQPDREIDFVMVRPGGGLSVLEHCVINEPAASDHRPVLAVLRFAP